MQRGRLFHNRFEIVQAAGEGGMGVVYRAFDRTTGEPVAVKVLHDAASPGHATRFAHEAKILNELEHPHVVKYITHGITSGDEPFLVMEWLEGENLSDFLVKRKLSVEETITLARNVASALGAAHARGVVHRDIKPSNIFLQHRSIETAKLLDFGIARFDQATTPLTATGVLLGTPGYMAPEQARADGETIDARADIFSLGCVLFECLTGRPAFCGMHAIALLAKLLMEEPPRVRDLCPAVPAFLDELCASMLAKEREKRPANGADVVRLLDQRASIAPPAPRSRTSALTDAENRLVSVIAMSTSVADAMGSSPDSTALSALPREQSARLRQAVVHFGAKVEELANGILVVLIVGAGPATDQAAQAARCALRLRSLVPLGPIVLLTGRSVSTERLPVGEVLESVASLLEKLRGLDAEEDGPPRIRIDATTRALLDVRFDVAEDGDGGHLWLRGEREIGGEARTLMGKPSPFVGRDREFRNLLEILEESYEEGRSSVVLVTGPAGAGKSRLRYEVVRALQASRPEVSVAIGRGDSMGAGSAFAVLASAFRSSLGIWTDEALSEQQRKLGAMVDRFVAEPERRRVLTFLAELIGAPFSDENNPQLRAARSDASVMATRIERAYVDFVTATASVIPVLFVLEDLHWGDKPSVKLIGAALKELQDKPFVVVAFARPEIDEIFPGLWNARSLQEIRLTPLSRRAAENLSRSVMGETLGGDVIAAIVDRAEGNAFYLEELIRAVVEGRGATLPETVLGMVEARLSALSADARRVLRAASIFGEVFWEQGVLVLLDDEQGDLTRTVLAELCEREVIVAQTDSRFEGEHQYKFRHALVREGAYSMLIGRDRVVGHQAAGEWLVAAGERDAMILASHFELGGAGKVAAEFYGRAAEQAHRAGDLDAAIARAAKGLACGAEGDVAATLHTVLGMAHLLNARFSTSFEHFVAAAEHGVDSPGVAASSGLAVCSALFAGRFDAFAVLLPKLMQAEPEPSGVASAVQALWAVGISLVVAGDAAQGLPSYQRMERLLAAHPEDLLAAGHGNAFRMNWTSDVGQDPYSALGFARASVESYAAAGALQYIPLVEAHGCMQQAMVGRTQEALLGLERVLATPDAGNLALAHAALWRCQTLLWLDKPEQAREAALALLKMASGDQLMVWAARLMQVECSLIAAQVDEAEKALDALGDPSVMIPCMRARALSLRARLRRTQGRLEEAEALAKEAVVHGRRGPRFHYTDEPLLLLHAEILHEMGDREAGRRVLREAYADLEGRLAKIPDPETRRACLENIPHHRRTRALAQAWLVDVGPG